ncbi:Reductase pytE [Fulvia fulva]|nr:Reductase pytE [Fulvia fulva]KAK4632780.1 Reductase pytE [Fulvia fulva]WPV10545.1 Reductase pytE [Fulvia fulva]WPV26902.1 Reductase pytE [Fulvia fulva]
MTTCTLDSQRHIHLYNDHNTNPTTSEKSKTLAFFGAGGDCAGYCLANSLKAGYTCRALARAPSKLLDSLKKKGVPQATIDTNLTIIQGDVKNLDNVKSTLQTASGLPVEVIISGIGGTPNFQVSLTQPLGMTEPNICNSAGSTILRAASEPHLQHTEHSKPLLVNISTTGIPAPGAPWDVPCALSPLYRWGLHVPHEDKAKLEEKLREEVRLSSCGIKGYVNIKPSLLFDGESKGLQAVKQGVDEKPAIGNSIHRQDVGLFIFEHFVKGEVVDEWINKSLTITY